MSRLRLRPSATFARVPDGVAFAGMGHSFVMKGPLSLFRLVLALAPALEAGVTREGLEALAPAAREVVSHLVDQLDGHDLLLHLDDVAEGSVVPADRERYADTLRYLEAVSADPYRAFNRWLAARIPVVGSTPACDQLRASLARMGVETRDAGKGDARPDIVLEVTAVDGGAVPPPVVADGLIGAPVVAAIQTHAGWIVVTDPEGDRGVANAIARWRHRHPGTTMPGRANGVAESLAVNLAALQALHLVAGVEDARRPPSGVRRALVVGDDLEVRVADVPAAPSPCGVGSADEVPDVDAAVPPPLPGLLDACDHLVDSDFGLTGPPSTDGLPQTPALMVAVATSAGSAHGCGLTYDHARLRALVHGLSRQAAWWQHPGAGVGAFELSPDQLVVVAGCSPSDWLARGLAWAARDVGGLFRGAPAETVELPSIEDREARFWLKTLVLRLEVPARVLVRRWGPLVEVEVGSGVSRLAVNVGCDANITVRDALMLAAATTQMERAGTAAALEPRAMPWLCSTPADTPRLGWSGASAGDVIEALRAEGWEPRIHRCRLEPALASAGLITGWVGMVRGG